MKSFTTYVLCSVLCSIALLMTNVSDAHQALPTIPTTTIPTAQPNGGPRAIIQGFADVEVIQPTSDYLSVVVYDEQNEIVYQTVTYEEKTLISTAGWNTGHYVISTEDASGDVQDFCIYIK